MVYTLRFFPSKCSLFHNSKVFGSYFIHILYTGCAKIKKNNSGAKSLKLSNSHIPLHIEAINLSDDMRIFSRFCYKLTGLFPLMEILFSSIQLYSAGGFFLSLLFTSHCSRNLIYPKLYTFKSHKDCRANWFLCTFSLLWLL